MSGNLISLDDVHKRLQAEAWAIPEPETRDYKGQAYTVTGSFQRKRKDSTMATVLEWTSHCAQCDAPFTCTTPAASAKFQPNRRCQKHKRPGHRVKGAAL
jgi:hypothetical protein